MFHDRDTRGQIRALKFGAAIAVLFIISVFKSCSQVKYALWGENASARITRTTGYRDEQAVTYFFELEGRQIKGQTSMPKSWTAPADGQIEVVYIKGTPEVSMPADQQSMAWILIMFGLIAAASVWLFVEYRRATYRR